MRARTLAILLLFGVAGPAAELWAYTFSYAGSQGDRSTPLRWTAARCAYTINPSHFSNVQGSNSDVRASLVAAFNAWQDVPTSLLTFTDRGDSSMQTRTSETDDNLVVLTDTSSSNNLLGGAGGALAVTFTQFFTSGELIDGDIVFNTNFDFFTTVPSSTTFDLRAVATHEVGHLIGLDHSANLSSTMFQSQGRGLSDQRSLSDDDIAAVSARYPAASFTSSRGSIAGRVTLTSTGQGVVGAYVHATDSSGILRASAITVDGSGNFLIEGLLPGTYTLIVEPLDGPVTRSSLGRVFRLDPSFDSTFRTTSGTSVNVTAGQRVSGVSLTVQDGSVALTADVNTGINSATSPAVFFSPSGVSIEQGTLGMQLVIQAGSGVNSSSTFRVGGTGVTLTFDAERSDSFSGSLLFYDLTVSPAATPGPRHLFITTGSETAILAGQFEVLPSEAPVNVAPVARAGLDQTVTPGTLVTLDGTESTDADGDALGFSWRQTGGPVTVGLDGPASSRPSFTTQQAGTYTFRLTVSDGRGGSDSDDVQVIVNTAPVARAGEDQTVEAGTTVVLDGGGSSDADGEALSYAWLIVAGPAGPALSGAATPRASFSPTVTGTYRLQLTVEDGNGGRDTDLVDVRVIPANRPPVASAGADMTRDTGTTVQLDGRSSSDPDGDPLTYTWTLLSGPEVVALSGSGTARPTFVPEAEGTYRFTLRVEDGRGGSDIDEVLVVAVRPNLPPFASAGASRTVTAGSVATLDASGSSDPDGDPITYSWLLRTGPATVPLGSPAEAVTTFVAQVEGVYLFRILVRDSRGATDGADVQITVVPPNRAPVARVDPPRSVLAGTEVILDSSLSLDPDGDVLSHRWTQIAGEAVALDGSGSSRARFMAQAVGVLAFEVRVTDGRGGAVTAQTQVEVSGAGVEEGRLRLHAGPNLVSLSLSPLTTDGAAFRASDLVRSTGAAFVAELTGDPSPAPGAPKRAFRTYVPGLGERADFGLGEGRGYVLSVKSSRRVTYPGLPWPR